MAGLKKKKREKSGSPNVVLVVFLVLFVITSITLGVFLYLALDEAGVARQSMKKVADKEQGDKNVIVYYKMLFRDLRAALGDKLDQNEAKELAIDRGSFDGGTFDKNITDKAVSGKVLADLGGKLNRTETGYEKNYPDLLDAERKKYAEIDGNWKTEQAAHAKTKETIKDLKAKQDTNHQAIMTSITAGNAATLAAAQKKSDDFVKLTKDQKKLNEDIKAESDKNLAMQKLKLMGFEIKKLRDELAQGGKAVGPGGAAVAAGGASFPLILDISPGKPLWDQPVGKVTRVDLDLRQVVINLGSAHGVQPELTFNVFGANNAGRAEKGMKGSLEVIKVIDTNSSLARITSLYDADGYEIQLNAQTRGRLLRETEAPMKEGDLLFNLFWGTRVAISGYVNITGEASETPSEQFRQMDDFLYLLRRSGVTVDAYVDLRDGQIKGNITSKTRYLIYGDTMRVAGEKPEAKMPEDDKEKEKEKDKDKDKDKDKEPVGKEPVKNGLANADRNEQINRSSLLLRNDAKTVGLLMISAENFANVAGYRKARNANTPSYSDFRPALPYAGSIDAGVRDVPARQEEKKEPPPPEKKDPN